MVVLIAGTSISIPFRDPPDCCIADILRNGVMCSETGEAPCIGERDTLRSSIGLASFERGPRLSSWKAACDREGETRPVSLLAVLDLRTLAVQA